MDDAGTPLGEVRARLRAFNAAREWGRYHSPRNLAMALSVEAGELLELYLWSEDGRLPVAERKGRLADEAADVLISLLNLCEAEGLDLTAATEAKLRKNAEKYPESLARGRLEKYDELPRPPDDT